MTPVSLPMWFMLVVLTAVPVHISVNKGVARWRRNYEISSMVTMTVVMAVCRVFLPLMQGCALDPKEAGKLLLTSCVFGGVFGAPIGLMFRAMTGHSRARPA